MEKLLEGDIFEHLRDNGDLTKILINSQLIISVFDGVLACYRRSVLAANTFISKASMEALEFSNLGFNTIKSTECLGDS